MMKYEAPELTALTPAINAIQTVNKGVPEQPDSPDREQIAAYVDWED